MSGTVHGKGSPRFNQCKSLTLSGTQNSAGSHITLTNGDGAQIVFSWDADTHQYTNKNLPGGQQSLQILSGGTYQLTHFATGEVETYNPAGQLIKRQDSNGNALSYAYTEGRLTSITSSNSTYCTGQSDFIFSH